MLDVDGSVWLGIGRWLVVGAGLAGAGYGLFASVRWVAGLVETWKGRGMPQWPRWRKRCSRLTRASARSACGSRDNWTLGQRLLYSSVHADHCFAS